jgi:phosphatidylinositol glycan class U
MAIRNFWSMAAAAVGFRLVLVLFGGDLHLASRPEVSTPLTSIRRRKRSLAPLPPRPRLELCCVVAVIGLIACFPVCFAVAEGYWLKQASMSPYSGSFHTS